MTAQRYFDAHNHLQDEWLDLYRETVLEQLSRLPVERAVVNGTCLDDWPDVADLASRFSWVCPSFGLHPWFVGNRAEDWFDRLVRQLDHNPAAALGEIGLDRWMLDRARPDDARLSGLRRAPLDEQNAVFSQQLTLAAERNLPVTIHCLDAWGALHDVLTSTALPERGFLLHAFGGSFETAKIAMARGAYFSFNGYFLDDRQTRVRDVFRALPLERVLMETDAPSMALPVAWRTYHLPSGPGGMPLNHPANLEVVYAGFAALRGISVAELCEIVAENFARLFGRTGDVES